MIPLFLIASLSILPVHHFVFGLAPGRYVVMQGPLEIGRFTAGPAGEICFSAPASAPITITREGAMLPSPATVW